MRLLLISIAIFLATLFSIYLYKNSDHLLTTIKPEKHLATRDLEILTLKGSNTIGEDFAPLLAEQFLKKQGAILINKIIQKESNQAIVEGYLAAQNRYIQIDIQAHGSTTGFKALQEKTTQIAMSSRQIKTAERKMLIEQYAHVNEEPIALDALAIVTYPNNPIDRLTIEQIAKIFSGEIVNWKELNGPDLPIKLFSRDNNSGTRDTFKTLVLKTYQKKLAESSLRYESSNELVEQLMETEGSIGFVGVSYIANAKLIGISEDLQGKAQIPSIFTIGTQNYPLSRKLFLYTVGSELTPLSRDFIAFSSQNSGQKLAENVGLVSYYPTYQRPVITENKMPRRYQELISMGNRITVDFSIDDISDKAKEARDIERLQHYIQQNPSRKLVLVDFSGSSNSQRIKDRLAEAALPVLDLLQLNFNEKSNEKLEVWVL